MLSSKPPPYSDALVTEARSSAMKVEGGFWTKSASASDYVAKVQRKLAAIAGAVCKTTPAETQRAYYEAAMKQQDATHARASSAAPASAPLPPTNSDAQLAATTLDLFDRKHQQSSPPPPSLGTRRLRANPRRRRRPLGSGRGGPGSLRRSAVEGRRRRRFQDAEDRPGDPQAVRRPPRVQGVRADPRRGPSQGAPREAHAGHQAPPRAVRGERGEARLGGAREARAEGRGARRAHRRFALEADGSGGRRRLGVGGRRAHAAAGDDAERRGGGGGAAESRASRRVACAPAAAAGPPARTLPRRCTRWRRTGNAWGRCARRTWRARGRRWSCWGRRRRRAPGRRRRRTRRSSCTGCRRTSSRCSRKPRRRRSRGPSSRWPSSIRSARR